MTTVTDTATLTSLEVWLYSTYPQNFVGNYLSDIKPGPNTGEPTQRGQHHLLQKYSNWQKLTKKLLTNSLILFRPRV